MRRNGFTLESCGQAKPPPPGHPARRDPATVTDSAGARIGATRPPSRWAETMSKKGKKVVVFSLTRPKSENPFTQLETRLAAFGRLRADFEELGLRVEVLDFHR